MISKEIQLGVQKELNSLLGVYYTHNEEFEVAKRKLNTKSLIEMWATQKEHIYEYFGQQLIWTSDEKITIDADKLTRKHLFDRFIESVIDTFERKYYFMANELDDFVIWLRENQEGFFDNRVISVLEGTEMKENSKLLKSFKYFFGDDETIVRELQDLASQYIQQVKIEGYLTLSIHPLDYMLISENNCKWRSCHALDGEYRAGNISYMLDNSCIVAYLRPAAKTQLRFMRKGDLWYDKKWRCLLFVPPDMNIMWIGRQYPFTSQELLNYFLRSDPIKAMGFSRFTCSGIEYVHLEGETINITLNSNHFLFESTIVPFSELRLDGKEAMNYCDLDISPHYHGMYSLSRNLWIPNSPSLAWIKSKLSTQCGVMALCPVCGKHFIQDSSSLMCDECKDLYSFNNQNSNKTLPF